MRPLFDEYVCGNLRKKLLSYFHRKQVLGTEILGNNDEHEVYQF